MKFLSDILARAGLVVEGTVTLNSVANATTDTDKFIVVDSGVVKYRTGAQLLSDIGGQVAGSFVPTSRTLTINGTTFDLSADRSWSITAGVSSVSAGSGISVSSTTGAVTVTNTGILSALAGSGISVSTSGGTLSISNTGLLSALAGSGISVSTSGGTLSISNTGILSGVAGSGISVSTSGGTLSISNTGLLSALAGSGISVSTSGGTLSISNTGLLSATAGSGISVSTSGGTVTVSNTGVLSVLAGSGISVSTSGGTVTVTNTITNNNQLTNGAGYITSSALSGYLPLTGGTLTGNLNIQTGSNPAHLLLRGTNPEMYIDGNFGGGTARLFINRQSTGNQATLFFTTGMTVTPGSAWNFTGIPMWSMGMTNSSGASDFKVAYGDIFSSASVALRIDTSLAATFSSSVTAAGGVRTTGANGYSDTDGTRTLSVSCNYTGGLPGIGTASNHDLGFFVNGTTLGMRITSGGNLLIGTTTDGGQKLQVNGNTTSQSIFIEGASGTGGAIRIKQFAGSEANMDGYSTISTLTSGVFYFTSSTTAPNFKSFQLDPSGLTTNILRTYTLPDTSGTIALTSDIPLLTLTTTGTSGAATLVGSTLNIPQYQAALINPVTGTGTTNYLPKWTSGSAIGDSNLTNDASGNLGLGVTPSAWVSGVGRTALQVGITSVSTNSANDSFFGTNYYDDGTNNSYINSDFSLIYAQQNGNHIWYNAPSGTAGNAISFTQAMTLDASGRLFVGLTSGYSNGVTIKGTSDDYALTIAQSNASNAGWGQWADTSGNYKLARYGGGSYSSPALTIALTGAATFSSSVTTGGRVNAGTGGEAFFWADFLEVRNSMRLWNAADSSFGLRFGFTSSLPYLQGFRETVGVTNLLLQPSSGSVLIGTTINPYSLGALVVNHNSSFTRSYFQRGVDLIEIAPSDGSGPNLISSSYTTSGSAYKPLSISARQNNADLYLTTGGRVAIGATDPGTAKLHIRGQQAATKDHLLSLSKFDFGEANFHLNYSNTFYTNGMSLEIEMYSLPLLQLAANNGATVGRVIFPNGNVGIGTASPANLLHLYGTDGNSYLRFTSDVATTGTRIGYNGTEFRIDQQQNADVTIRTNGGERVRVISTGQVRFNNYTSSSAFTGTAVATLAVDSSGNVITVAGSGGSQWVTSGSNIFYNTGNVAIGTTNTSAGLLTLRGFTGGTAGSAVAGYAKTLVIGGDYNQLYNVGNAVLFHIADYSNDATDNVYPIYVEDENNIVDFFVYGGNDQSVNTKKAYFGGSVGIGTISPSKTLHVYTSGNEGIFLQGAGGGVWMDIQASGGQIHSVGAQVGGMGIYNRTLGLYRFFITDGGNVGIGTVSPNHRLDVNGDINIPGGNKLVFNNEPTGWYIHARTTTSTTNLGSALKNIIISGGGSTEGFAFTGVGTGATAMEVRNDGRVWVRENLNVGGTITESSTIKIKENIAPVTAALDKVDQLKPVSYNKKGSTTKEIGLIAEDVFDVFPEFVLCDDNGEPVGVHYSRLTAVLIESVKELKKEINELKNRN